MLGVNHGPAVARKKLHVTHAAAFDDVCALQRGASNENFIELRASHLVGVLQRLVPAFGEFERLAAPVPLGEEFRAPLLHPDGFDLLEHTEALEQRKIGRQQRFADVEAGMAGLLEQGCSISELYEPDGRGAPCRAAANHQHIGLPGDALRAVCVHKPLRQLDRSRATVIV